MFRSQLFDTRISSEPNGSPGLGMVDIALFKISDLVLTCRLIGLRVCNFFLEDDWIAGSGVSSVSMGVHVLMRPVDSLILRRTNKDFGWFIDRHQLKPDRS